MCYILSTKILQGADTAIGTVLQKVVLEFVVKILDKYTKKEFLKTAFQDWTSSPIFFKGFDYSYYNNSLKYVANRTLFSKTPVIVSTKNEFFLKDFFSKFEDISKEQLLMHSHFLKKFLRETFHFSGCWLLWRNEIMKV